VKVVEPLHPVVVVEETEEGKSERKNSEEARVGEGEMAWGSVI
jgi:hypothetical protein